MLIPNKYNGYQAGIRIYPVGGGVGEAMLLGAAMGGGAAAVTGGDPLKGALLGGVTGGIGGGVSTLAADTALQTGTNLAGQAAADAATNTATNALTNTATQGATQAGIAGLPSAATTPTSFGSFGEPAMVGSPAATMADPTGLAQAQLNLNAATSNAIPPTGGTFGEGMARFAQNPLASMKANPFTAGSAALAGAIGARQDPFSPTEYEGPLKRFRFNPETYRPAMYADGGIATLTSGGYDRMVGEEPQYPENMASGGISSLGSYSDGGRMLKGPGDGMSDSIPASIGNKRPARLADGEFVVPADVVSHLGNGSTDAGAKQLYAMMDKVRSARTGRKSQGREINPRKYMPA